MLEPKDGNTWIEDETVVATFVFKKKNPQATDINVSVGEVVASGGGDVLSTVATDIKGTEVTLEPSVPHYDILIPSTTTTNLDTTQQSVVEQVSSTVNTSKDVITEEEVVEREEEYQETIDTTETVVENSYDEVVENSDNMTNVEAVETTDDMLIAEEKSEDNGQKESFTVEVIDGKAEETADDSIDLSMEPSTAVEDALSSTSEDSAVVAN